MVDFDHQRHRCPMEEDLEEGEFPVEEEKPPLLLTNKLKIKLKVVSGEIVEKKDDHGVVRNGGGWICGLCRKEFKSGKALGGHMRVHAPPQPTSPAGGGGFGRKSYYLQDLEGMPMCSLCNKTFQSEKSLFGHMRCHPERDWRGMNPPEINGYCSPSSTIDSDREDEPVQGIEYCSSSGAVDLSRYLDNWSVKKARSSGAGKRTAIDAARQNLSEDEIGAVEALMLLSKDKTPFSLIRPDGVIGVAEKPISSSNKNTADEIQIQIQDQKYGDDDSDNNSKIKIQLDCDQDTPMMNNNNTDSASKKRKRIHEQFINSAPRCYRCSVCSKTFPTPQALGGHKSSAHNKPLIKISLADPELTLRPHNYHDSEDHICKICDKGFPSGQALGGHMRRHYPGPSPATAGKMQLAVMSSDQSGSLSAAITCDDGIKEPVVGFDLNELPDADDAVVEQW